MQVVTDQVIEVIPSTILRHLEGRRPCTVLDAPDGYKVQVEFTFHVDDDGKIGPDEVGAKNHKHSPILNARAIKSLVEGSTVTYSTTDPDIRYHVKLVEPADEKELRAALSNAFRAHKSHDFGGKDPRRVWNDFEGSDEFDYRDYKPSPHWAGVKN